MKIVKENSIAKAGPSQSEKTRLISLDGSKYILPATVIEQVYDEETKKSLGVILEEIKQNAGGSGGSVAGSVPEMQVWKERNFFDLDDPPAALFIMIPDQAFAGPSEFTTGDTFKVMGRTVACTLTSGQAIPDGYFQANSRVLMLWDAENTHLWIIGSNANSGEAVSANSIKLFTPPAAPGKGQNYTGPIRVSSDSSSGVIKFYNEMDSLGSEYAVEVPVDNAKKIGGKTLNMSVSGTTLDITYV